MEFNLGISFVHELFLCFLNASVSQNILAIIYKKKYKKVINKISRIYLDGK